MECRFRKYENSIVFIWSAWALNHGGKSENPKDASFTWWIYKTDGEEQYYEDYVDGPIPQFINQQYWDVENGGIGTAETGSQLKLSYLVPITGSEQDNFNTMLSTGEYPELFGTALFSCISLTIMP